MHELGAERRRDAEPHRPGTRRLQKAAGRLGLIEMRHQDAVFAGIAGDDAVFGKIADQFADDPLRQDRLLIGAVFRRVEIALLVTVLHHPPLPRLAPPIGARADGLDELAEDLRRVAEHDLLGRVVPRRVARFDVDLHKGLAGRIEELCVLPGRIARAELGADDQHEIGFADAGIRGGRAEGAEDAERQGMRFREGALAGGGRRDRQTGRLGQRAELVVGLSDADAVAGNDS